MIKKLALAVLLSSTALSAFAAEDAGKDFYAQLNGGYAFGAKNKDSDGFGTFKSASVGLEAGARINEHFRLGLSLDYMPKFTGDKGSLLKFSTMPLMLNAFLDAGDFSGFKPYVVVGAGISRNKTSDVKVNGTTIAKGVSKTGFAYKAGLGTKYALSDEFDVDVRYQYIDLAKIKFKDDSDTAKVTTHQIMLGVAYKF
jgi:opacity protein-like surface antigen